jgi:Mrp family chromosome partitioning ATPase
MSEDCNHDCEHCGENPGECGESQDFSSFRAEANPGSEVKKVIGIVSGKGGVGKSLVTSLLAVAANRRNKERESWMRTLPVRRFRACSESMRRHAEQKQQSACAFARRSGSHVRQSGPGK